MASTQIRNLLLAIALGLVLLMLLQMSLGTKGCSLPKRAETAQKTSEDDSFFDKAEVAEGAKLPASLGKIDPATLRKIAAQALWVDLAEAFKKGSDAVAAAVVRTTDWQAFGLAADEIEFYKGVRKLVESSRGDLGADDWLQKLRQAGFCYETAAANFEAIKKGSSQQPERLYADPALEERLAAKMKTDFSLGREQIDGLLKKYPEAAPGKWASLAFFVQQ